MFIVLLGQVASEWWTWEITGCKCKIFGSHIVELMDRVDV